MWSSRIFKGLRFRLALSYAIFFAVLLTGFGFVLRGMLRSVVENTVEGLLDEEFAACKGFLQINGKGQIGWRYDPNDKQELAILERLRLVYMIADEKGEVLESSEMYRDLGFQSPAEIAKVLADSKPTYSFHSNLRGQIFMVRQGEMRERNNRFFVSLGRNFTPSLHVVDEFSFDYFSALPLIILTAAALGWLLAGRAMQPVADVAAQVEKVSGSNLSLRVPLRQSGDELDHMIKTFNGMVGRLEQSFQQIRQFSTDVSHELRTPITVVRGQLEVALMTATNEEELRVAIESALLDIDRLSQIVRALLQLAKAEGGQLALQMQEVDLASLIREVVGELEIPALDRNISLSHDLPRFAYISADRIQIERLLYNLIDNAIKYTPEGGFVATKVHLSEDASGILLEIRDNGIGIEAEHLPHLFDRFYRVPTRASGAEKGLGLGLSFVSWIVKAHNGEIQVKSEIGKGTTFTVTFPSLSADTKNLAEHGIKERLLEGIRILDLTGSLVAGEACQMLREHATAQLDTKPRVVLNLAGIDYIDSSGLGMLVNCFSTLERSGGGMRILSPSARDMELMVLTKLATVFQVFNDEQEAVNSFFPDREIKKFDILSFVQEQRKVKDAK